MKFVGELIDLNVLTTRLAGARGLARGNGAATWYSYDPVSRLAAMTHDLAGTVHDLTLGFSYNPAGQIATNARSNDAYSFTASSNTDTGYTPDGLNRYAQVGAVTPYYDARGNLTSYAGAAYGYTADNQLTLSPGSAYAYDPAGRLWHETVANSVLSYTGEQLIQEMDGSTGLIRRRYVPGASLDRSFADDDRRLALHPSPPPRVGTPRNP